MLAASHEHGWWRTIHELDEGTRSIIDRPFWTPPFMSDKEPTFVDPPSLIDYVGSNSRPSWSQTLSMTNRASLYLSAGRPYEITTTAGLS
ncbi:hypothetical protein AS19_18430 [Alcanivorax sp. NBRC 101098]|nr:hypothetical protein AS19_18430 [Alcanivorax sp. NBRC 101098]